MGRVVLERGPQQGKDMSGALERTQRERGGRNGVGADESLEQERELSGGKAEWAGLGATSF